MLFARGLFGACERELSLEDLPLGGAVGNAVRTHSLKTAVEGQGTSYHPGWLLCHFGPDMGPPLTNVQLGGRKHIQQHRAGLQQGNSVLEP